MREYPLVLVLIAGTVGGIAASGAAFLLLLLLI